MLQQNKGLDFQKVPHIPPLPPIYAPSRKTLTEPLRIEASHNNSADILGRTTGNYYPTSTDVRGQNQRFLDANKFTDTNIIHGYSNQETQFSQNGLSEVNVHELPSGTVVKSEIHCDHTVNCDNDDGSSLCNPLRSIHPEANTATGSLELEGKMVDTAIENVLSLPQVVSEVASMQKDQTDEVQRQTDILEQLEKKLAEESALKEDVIKEIQSIVKKTCMVEGEVTLTRKACKITQTELDEIVDKIEDTKYETRLKTICLDSNARLFNIYKMKMEEYKKKVNLAEEQHEIHKKVKLQQEKIHSLQQKKRSIEGNPLETSLILSGGKERALQSEITALTKEHKRLEKLVDQKKDQIEKEKGKQWKTKQDTDVLHKRNAAQLTRLKRQVNELTSRKRQWNEQASQLEHDIAKIKETFGHD
ncbi:unnamed protein product [Owenia fusiformis]|uniref:Uncharacterized protein n=1 Tax=Owenia fusiformis TaxID=6347 RepID=A0A8J1XUW7_OWEFU|nr:unnamed protein product [Owenia fusiformis]